MILWKARTAAPVEADRPRIPLRDKLKTVVDLMPTAILILVVLGTIYGGLATATESAALGVVGAMISTTVSGKVIAMWMPIMVFFYMVFEHSIVNMFLFPSGLFLGAKFSWLDYFMWNEIPTVVGNLVGGLAFTGLTLYATHLRTAPKRVSLRTAA